MKALLPAIRVAPEIAAELRQQIIRINAGSLRLSGIPGSDDPGFASAYAPQTQYRPDPERLAAQFRAAREHPVDRETTVDWLQMLFYGWLRHQPEGGAREACRLTIAPLCGELPLAAWSQDLLKRARLTFNRSTRGPCATGLACRDPATDLSEARRLLSEPQGAR